MSDLTLILGNDFNSKKENSLVKSPFDQLSEAMLRDGITPPDDIIMDGKLRRFRSDENGSKDKTGWYVIYSDGITAGAFGCWRRGIETKWHAQSSRVISELEHAAFKKKIEQAIEQRKKEEKLKNETAEQCVETIWKNAQDAHQDHPYLKRKGIQPNGARVTGDGRLIVPLFDKEFNLKTLQYIDHDGGKLYHTGGQTGSNFWIIGDISPGNIYIAEGFATAATIFETMKRPVVVAYSASNLVPVTGIIKTLYSNELIIVADNDKSGVGQRYAEQACAKHGARMIVMPVEGDANDYLLSGNDLVQLLTPRKSDWLIAADDFCQKPAPISWLVKKWIQSDALIMVHGPSGGGKTFVVLDMCLRIASSIDEWSGHKVKNGNVIYLAGEGHHGLKARIAAWKQHHAIDKLSLWLSKSGCDLNTNSGYLQIVDHIRSLEISPKLIVVDTLHRFLSGDENSAQDAKTMLDACAGIMKEFSAAVLLVHHTGVSDDAQHRARGSSAWKGALDIEISIVPARNERPIEIIQRKAKDSEIADSIFCELKTVEINGWIDEDGELVTSAVLIDANSPKEIKKDSKIEYHRKTFENAWRECGREDRNGSPYLSKSALIFYLMKNLDVSENTAKQYIKPTAQGKLIAELLNANIIAVFENGWIVCSDVHASAMMMSVN